MHTGVLSRTPVRVLVLWALITAPPPALLQGQAAPGASLPVAGPETWGKWETAGIPVLSPDGRWVAYTVSRVNEENELRAHPVDRPDSTVVVAYGTGPMFSADGRWMVYTVGKSEAERRRLERERRPVRNDLGIVDLRSGVVTLIREVSSFSLSPDGSFLAMRRYAPEGTQGQAGPGGALRGRGTDLVVRRLADGLETPFGNVSALSWHDRAPLLAYLVDADGRAGNGVHLFDAATSTLRTLESDTASYTALAWRKDGDDLVVLKARPDSGWADTTHAVLAWTGLRSRNPVARVLEPAARPDFPEGMRITDFRTPEWSRDGSVVHLGLAPREPVAGGGERGEGNGAGGGARAEDTPSVEIWHARDVDIIPTQKVNANRDRRAVRLAAWHLTDGSLVPLADEAIPTVNLYAGGTAALAIDGSPYDPDRMFGPAYNDLYHVDLRTGARTRVAERRQWHYGISPGGRYVLFQQDDHYWVHDLRSGERRNLTAGLDAVFVNLQNDHTIPEKPPFGIGGWTEGDRHVLVYDRFDVWALSPDGRERRRLTQGAEEGIRYRVVNLDPDRDSFDPAAPIYLSLAGERTKETGYARMRIGDRSPEILVRSSGSVGFLRKARDAEVYLYRTEHFHEPPSFHVADSRLSNPRRVGGVNAFHGQYAWGRSELVDFVSDWGDTLQAALFYPADWEPGRRYPMIVYHYEIVSSAVNRYVVPSDRSPYNTAVFTNTGYFVLQPDIVYRPRNPGLSAKASIEAAVRKVLETGMVDPARVGIMGHSWGGYQTTFLSTTSELFAAAVAGAPLTNLVSMYLSIYWNTGGTDARIFEISQGRMEVPPWEDMASYTANSPVHNIETMRTPLLMAFGTEDGAVEFNQGVEFYNAARRAGKDMVLLVYEGENHSLARRPNQLDYHRRIREWFDHYLKGEPAPRWITDGVPWLEQERERRNPPPRLIQVNAVAEQGDRD